MLREEAISVLNDYDINFERHTPEEVAEAHEMAIKALGQQLSEDVNTIVAKIYGQPQSEKRTEEHTETHECDCISRKLMHDMGATCIAARNENGDLVALGALDILPSATPQPKTGHWIEHKHGGIEHIECSECGIWFLKADLPRKSYCPNCGSRNGDMIKNIMRDIAKQ